MSVRIMAVGDDIIHKQLYEAAHLPEGGYRFYGMFDGVRIASHDIVPLVTHTDSSYGHFTTYALADYTDEMAAENKIFAVVEKNRGIHVDVAYLRTLFDDILHYRAQAYNEYKTPWDVNRGNLKGVLNALRGKNVKG